MGNSESRSTHMVHVKTGVKKGAGTNSNVYVALGDENGTWSGESRIDTRLKNDFESGNTDVFDMELPGMARITELAIRRDDTGILDSWYLENVRIQDLSTGYNSVFPVNRWIHADTVLRISEHNYFLPHQDKYPEQRSMELENMREQYKLVSKVPGIPKQIESVPEDENFNIKYTVFIGATTAQLGIETKFAEYFVGDFKTLNDFEDVYIGAKVTTPKGALNWRSDEEFGNQRVAGVNPTRIVLCTSLPEKFAVTGEMVKDSLEGRSLQEAMNEGKIYLIDYTYLENLQYTNETNEICAPYGLFYSKENGDFIPIAIQLMPQPGADNPVFLPSDPEYTWLLAKMWFNLADASVHESASHLGFTHILMESVVVCTKRQLSSSHPVFQLLAPHFLYLLAINDAAITQLLGEGAWVDQAMEIGCLGMYDIIRREWSNWNLMVDGHLPNRLKQNGTDCKEKLPNYPYRDDALLIWNAIHNYVSEIVNSVYSNADALLNDSEIQAFAQELSSPEGAGIKGVPEKFTSNDELSDVLTSFIFISSVQHAAVNFGQYDEYGFAPNYPASMRSSRPLTKEPFTEDDIVRSLPTKLEMLNVIRITGLLSSPGTQPLGDFETEYAAEPSAVAAVKQFRNELKAAQNTIEKRNEERVRKYTILLPDAIPNAISI